MDFMSNHRRHEDTEISYSPCLRVFAVKFSFLLWLLPLGFIGLFFFYPLVRILAYSFDIISSHPGKSSISLPTFYFLRFTKPLLSTLLTLLLGLPAAYLFARFDFPGKPCCAR